MDVEQAVELLNKAGELIEQIYSINVHPKLFNGGVCSACGACGACNACGSFDRVLDEESKEDKPNSLKKQKKPAVPKKNNYSF